MATYAEVQAMILGDLHRSDITAEVQTAMSNAVVKLRMDRYWFNEDSVQWVTTTNSDYDLAVTLPTLLHIDTMRVWDSGEPMVLDRIGWAELMEHDESDTTGVPSHWAVHHHMLHLYPTPDSSMTMETSGLVDLSITAWCSYAPNLLRATAEVELFGFVTHDLEGAQRVSDLARSEREALLRRSPTAASSGEVRGYL